MQRPWLLQQAQQAGRFGVGQSGAWVGACRLHPNPLGATYSPQSCCRVTVQQMYLQNMLGIRLIHFARSPEQGTVLIVCLVTAACAPPVHNKGLVVLI